ncbi:cilia- and flagella-associated protein 221-like [Antedon mediterranea]|uniref:cilia- and flagella-associated protein 221-like n=1 Tax=Antedon mediterranea TaxID=105859 RepID=UPI003AF61F9E
MAVARPLSQIDILSQNGIRSSAYAIPDTLVAPHTASPVPNHLLDTKIFHKISQNELIQARPASIHFAGFAPGKLHKLTLTLGNVSTEVVKMHIIPPTTKYFKIWYTKGDRLVPGLTMDCTIEFRPDEWRYFYDCIRIHCKGDSNLIVPIHAYPVMNTSDFPQIVRFPPTPISQSKTQSFPLRCHVPIDFEFLITYIQPHPSFYVEPIKGVVPANGECRISITFTPTDYTTAHLKFQVFISQFESKPLVCAVSGNSAPGLAQTELNLKTNDLSDATSNLDPRSITPIGLARKKKLAKIKKRPQVSTAKIKATKKEVEIDGIRFPPNLNSQHAVNSVLLQQAGKLRVKDLREAVLSKKHGQSSTRQMKEALFEKELKEDIDAERRNQLRWQVCLGRKNISIEERQEILDSRAEALQDYHFKRGDPIPHVEFGREETGYSTRRTYRLATSIPSHEPTFDTYKNNMWWLRHETINRFQQAARKVIIRNRVNKRLPIIRKLIDEFKSGRAGRPLSVTYGERLDEEILKDVPPLDISTDRVKSWAFPSYTSPDYKDDMAPDALGLVPTRRSDVVVKKEISFSDLSVPRHYKSMGYQPHSVHQASLGYVPPKLARPLRNGADDEVINMPLPQTAWTDEQMENSQEDHLVTTPGPGKNTLQLVPPGALFKPTEYPPLHIFNPCPGLQTFLPPLPYSEVDPDFNLCPLPQYNHSNKNSKHGNTTKIFLDREDVIKNVMQWKKFPSQGLVSLANTPTLTNVWVPRWTDPFSSELLPVSVPPLLDGLPEEDKENILTENCDEDEERDNEGENLLMLTPNMVRAEFTLIDRPLTPDDKETDEFPYGTKLPSHNNPVSSTGPVPREKREQELEGFLLKRYNQLGQKIQSTINSMHSLLTDPKLALK